MFSVLCIAVVFCLAQCSSQSAIVPPASTSAPATVVSDVTPDATTQAPADGDADIDDFVPFNNSRHTEFDYKLIRAVLAGRDTSNVIVSPFSVKLLMSLLAEAAGSNTTTEKELAGVLPDVKSIPMARELYAQVLRSLQEPSQFYDFKIATKIYLDQRIQPRQRFAAIAEANYFTHIEPIDFVASPAAAGAIINHWVADATQNRITDLVDSNDLNDAVMLMLNAIYFQGFWRKPFPVDDSLVAPFFTAPNAAAQRATFMHQTDTFFYADSLPLDAKVLRLPYRGRRFAMTLLLPNNASAPLAPLVERLEAYTLRRAQYYMDEVEVRVQLPRFKFDYTAPLVPVLKELGITAIFGNEASLPLLARGVEAHDRLQVSQVLQKAGIEVHEKGSTAYAATEVVLANRIGGETTHEFIANRPFVFVIEDESTGAILFAGQVANPAEFASSDEADVKH